MPKSIELTTSNGAKGAPNSMHWIELSGRTGYILSAGCLIPTYILNDREIVMIDSGMQEEPEMIRFLRENDISVRAVLQTHLHIDHVCNNNLFIQNFGTEIYAHPSEIWVVHSRENMYSQWNLKDPETLDIYYQSYSYHISPLPADDSTISLDGALFKVIQLPGHSLGHVGIVTPDNVLCVGDALLSPYMVKHSKLPYYENLGRALASIRKLQTLDYPCYALAHMEIIQRRDMPGLIRANLAEEKHVNEEILEIINDPVPLNDLVTSALYALDINIHNPQLRDYIWISARRRIEYLGQTGRVRIYKENGTEMCSLP